MPAARFDLQAPFTPAGDQPRAITELNKGLARGDRFQTLLGVTGSGKTMTVANVIQAYGRPTLVLSHNKTLAAQLYGELKSFFPHNAVEYFISYYDYYQPEAYVPTTDTYIEKDASINEDIDRLRLRATSSLMERDDVVIVSTVSAIYGLGDPETYRETMLTLSKGQRIARDDVLRALVRIQYSRNDVAFDRGTFRVRGDTVEIFPAYEEQGVRVEMWGDDIERISKINIVTGETIASLERAAIYPAKHFITSRPTVERAVGLIRSELAGRLDELRRENKLLEAQRLESRTNFDIEMMLEIGTCAGIENYSRHLSGRGAGERPACLFDYFP
jgi:excinuclease ABC subunit B